MALLATTIWPAAGNPAPTTLAWMLVAVGAVHGPEVVVVIELVSAPVRGAKARLPMTAACAAVAPSTPAPASTKAPALTAAVRVSQFLDTGTPTFADVKW